MPIAHIGHHSNARRRKITQTTTIPWNADSRHLATVLPRLYRQPNDRLCSLFTSRSKTFLSRTAYLLWAATQSWLGPRLTWLELRNIVCQEVAYASWQSRRSIGQLNESLKTRSLSFRYYST